MMRFFKSTNRAKTLYSTPARAFGGLLILLILTVLILELTNTTHFFHNEKAVSGTITTTTKPKTTTPKTTPSSSIKESQGAGTGTPAATPPASVSLIAPYGTFVSNHRPGQNGSPTTEESLCNTTAGATCYIRFTQGSVVRTLPAQTTDNSGSTIWDWEVGKAGLTSGSWQVAAVATLHGQSKTTTDPIALEVE